MEASVNELKFVATPEKGEVSALLLRPADATHLLVLAHGAGSSMRSPMLAKIADALAETGVATFRYNFPYSEHGRARDSNPVCAATARSACAAARAAEPALKLLAGGHSFGGRMTSTAASQEPLQGVSGLVFFSFPLHPPGRPAVERAEHLANVEVPMLFLTGTRDEFASGDLLPQTVSRLGKRATLHLVDTADHGFKVLKRSRESKEDVFAEIARVTANWARTIKMPGKPWLAVLLLSMIGTGCITINLPGENNSTPAPQPSATRTRQPSTPATVNGKTISADMSDEEILKVFGLEIRSATSKVSKGPDGYSTAYAAGEQTVSITRSIVSGVAVSASGPVEGGWHLGGGL